MIPTSKYNDLVRRHNQLVQAHNDRVHEARNRELLTFAVEESDLPTEPPVVEPPVVEPPVVEPPVVEPPVVEPPPVTPPIVVREPDEWGSYGVMGPNGLHWPSDTPDPWAPATRRLTDYREFNKCLAQCEEGDVVDVTGAKTPPTTSKVELVGGSPHWKRRVLFRSSEHLSHTILGDYVLKAHNVVCANLKVGEDSDTTTGELSMSSTLRSAIARVVYLSNDQILLSSTKDSGLYDFVIPTYRGGGGDDWFRIGGAGGLDWVGSQNLVLAGGYAKGKFRPDGSDGHCDWAQTWSPNAPAVGTKIIDTVAFSSADKVFQGEDGHVTDMWWINVWANSPAHSIEPIPDGMNMGPYAQSISAPGDRFLFVNATILGQVNHKGSTTKNTGRVIDSRIRGGSALTKNNPEIVRCETGSSVNIKNYPPPPLPDLKLSWARP